MKLMVSSYNNGGVEWNAAAEETALRSYSIVHEFNSPAECRIVLADPDGTKVQKYNTAANDVYLGVGKITLEDPDDTDIFYGRIVKASATVENNKRYCVLVCKDWLDQLDGEQIQYDMREDLDGSGLRQSTIATDYDDTDGNGIKPAHNVGGPSSWVYDKSNILTVDAHNGQKFAFCAGMAGSNTWKCGPYTETVTPSFAPMAVDTFDNDIGDLWTDDNDCHTMSDNADFYVTYGFRLWTPDSSTWFQSITGARIRIKFSAHEDFDVTLQVNSGGYEDIDELAHSSTTTIETRTVEIPEHLLSGLFDANGEGQVRIDIAEATGGVIYIYWIEYEIDTVTTGSNGVYSIIDTLTYKLLLSGYDFSADATKIWDGIPYSIAKEIYLHLESATGPIGGGDSVVELTYGVANIENTSGVSFRQYNDMSRLDILKNLADQDLSVFWITLGGSTVTYKQTFGADTMQLTDGKVESYQSLQDYDSMINEVTVHGARIGDYAINENVAGATSQTKFLEAQSKVIKNPGIISPGHAKAIATALVAREDDVSQFISCIIAGNTATAAHATTIKLGEVVEITSSELWSTASKDYIVSRWAYDSVDHKTYLTMYPKVSTGLPVIDTPHNRESTMQDTLKASTTSIYIPDPVTHEVS